MFTHKIVTSVSLFKLNLEWEEVYAIISGFISLLIIVCIWLSDKSSFALNYERHYHGPAPLQNNIFVTYVIHIKNRAW